MNRPWRRCTLSAAMSMVNPTPKAATRLNKPTMRPNPPKNSATTAKRASGAGIPRYCLNVPKVFCRPGPPNQQKTLGTFKQYLGIPAPLALLAVVAEFFGGLGLIVGLLSRVAAFGVGFTMLIAALKVHLRHGLFINWSGEQQGHGFEFHLLAIAMAAAIIVHGAWALSLDAILSQMI